MLHIGIVRFFILAFIALMIDVSAAETTLRQSPKKLAEFAEPGSNTPKMLFSNLPDTVWANYEQQVGQPLLAWAKREVGYLGGGAVFYPFSGPDFVTIERVFPNAQRYVMVAIQSARKPAAPETMAAKQRQVFEKNLSEDWQRFGQLGYFRTNDLDNDQFDHSSGVGVTTLLMAFAARLGYEVMLVEPLGFNVDRGDWEPRPSNEQWTSVRLSLRKDGKWVALDYIKMDLSDNGLKASEPLKTWIKWMSTRPTLLKAASHLLQKNSFSFLRNSLIEGAPIVIQDETGLEYNDLSKIGSIRLYGKFTQSHYLFTSTMQHALAAAYKAEKSPKGLPFAFSYLKTAESRSMQIADRNVPKK